jgi:hypothetical protein
LSNLSAEGTCFAVVLVFFRLQNLTVGEVANTQPRKPKGNKLKIPVKRMAASSSLNIKAKPIHQKGKS